VIDSLRVGLPALDVSTRELAIGSAEMQRLFQSFLDDVRHGGGAMLLRGQYGEGKTFMLTMLEEIARESGFITARTEIDATENRLSKPHYVYHDFLRNLRLPDSGQGGAPALALKVREVLATDCPGGAYRRMRYLEDRLGCYPLSWLLADHELIYKPELIQLLECDPNCRVTRAREAHCICPPKRARQWPAFTAGTQGDFASFVLSGIGRLATLLGYKGLILIMDEMEKWADLNWTEQSRAGNLLGGLIWGARAEEGQRKCEPHACMFGSGRNNACDHPEDLAHSGRCGGYPFSTIRRSHVGIAIAVTPRGQDDPALQWSRYGELLEGAVPTLTTERLRCYTRLVVPYYAKAYGLEPPSDKVVEDIRNQALNEWRRHGGLTTRSGVQAVIKALDDQRHRGWGDGSHERRC
jgi:hypothetical protein